MGRSEHEWVDHIEGELRITATELAGKEQSTDQELRRQVPLIALALLVGYTAFVASVVAYVLYWFLG